MKLKDILKKIDCALTSKDELIRRSKRYSEITHITKLDPSSTLFIDDEKITHDQAEAILTMYQCVGKRLIKRLDSMPIKKLKQAAIEFYQDAYNLKV